MVRNYTTRRHIARIEPLLKEDNLYKLCPASMQYNKGEFKHIPWTNLPCIACYSFIGLKMKLDKVTAQPCCPCRQLGREEAVRRTLKAIKKFRLKRQRLTFLRK